MLFGSLCMSAFQALIAFISGDSSSGVSNTNDDNGVFLTDKNSRIVFEKPPEYFTKHNSHNRRLISCESMQEAVKSVIGRFIHLRRIKNYITRLWSIYVMHFMRNT